MDTQQLEEYPTRLYIANLLPNTEEVRQLIRNNGLEGLFRGY